MNKGHWSIAGAKASLSRVVEDAAQTPQIIEKRGKPVAVVVSFEGYFRAVGDPDAGAPGGARWRAFLAASAKLRAAGGAVLPVARRRPRRSPLGEAS